MSFEFSYNEEDACPVCYKSLATRARLAVPCNVCKHAVCDECDTMLTQAWHVSCPMCRAPRLMRQPLTLDVAMHAFHCKNTACDHPRCQSAKRQLMIIEAHTQSCAAHDECQVCKVWDALKGSLPPRSPSDSVSEPAARARTRSETHAASAAESTAESTAESAAESLRRRQDWESVRRGWLRELEPWLVKRMLLSHVRNCCDPQCNACHLLRERLRMRGYVLGLAGLVLPV